MGRIGYTEVAIKFIGRLLNKKIEYCSLKQEKESND